MKFTIQKTVLGMAAVATLSTAPAFAEEFTAEQKEELGGIIQQYLMDNPSVIFESIEAYRSQQEQEAQKQAEAKIDDNIAYLTRAEAPSVGNPEGDVTVVEFFDYNCGYCKRAVPDIQALVKEDENVRFVFKEMPILGPTSKTAAIWALAAHKQGKYFEYHVALMEHKGQKTEAELAKVAQDIGLDVDAMKKVITSGELDRELDKVMSVAREIGVSGTPAFVVGSQFIPGYVGKEGLVEAIKEERAKMKKDG